jgi:uncharacterized heparinase superfamily protein
VPLPRAEQVAGSSAMKTVVLFAGARLAFSLSPRAGAHPLTVALGCARGQAVIQAGFDRFGAAVAGYRALTRQRLSVDDVAYVAVLPTPAASGSHAWAGGGTTVAYSLPTGP